VFKSVQVVFRRIGQVYAKRRPTLGARGEFPAWPRAGRYLLRKIFGHVSLPACSRGEKPIDRNHKSPEVISHGLGDYCLRSRAFGPSALRASDEPSARDCTLEAMHTQGRFSS